MYPRYFLPSSTSYFSFVSECDSEKTLEDSNRKRMFSNDSCHSETLEENFVKMTVDYVTGFNVSKKEC